MHVRTQTLFIFTLTLTAMLAVVSFALAQGTPSTTTASSTPQAASTTTETATSSATNTSTSSEQSTPAVSLPALPIEKQVRVTNLAANISNRSEAYIRRFETIAVRIDSRIAKTESEGYDMTDARFYVTEARDALRNATTELRDIDLRINRFVTSGDYINAWIKIKLSFTETRAHLERAKMLLEKAVDDINSELEGGVPTAESNPDTEQTASTTDVQ